RGRNGLVRSLGQSQGVSGREGMEGELLQGPVAYSEVGEVSKEGQALLGQGAAPVTGDRAGSGKQLFKHRRTSERCGREELARRWQWDLCSAKNRQEVTFFRDCVVGPHTRFGHTTKAPRRRTACRRANGSGTAGTVRGRRLPASPTRRSRRPGAGTAAA